MISRSFQTFAIFPKQIAKTMCTANSPIQKTQRKTYRMPEPEVIDFFNPEIPPRLHNFRLLLYANKQNLLTPALLQCKYAIPFGILIYLIRFNPWYLTFPASLPIMMGVQIVIFGQWILHKRFNKLMIQRVYVYRDNYVEFHFSNKLRRKFKNLRASHLFISPDELKTPSTTGKTGEIQWAHKGFPFPTELVYKLNESTGEIECMPASTPLTYGWTKYASNYQNYIFPKHYEYANWELLVPLFNGRFINFDNCQNTIHELPEGENMVSLDEELKWIKEDQEIYQQIIQEKKQERLKNKGV